MWTEDEYKKFTKFLDEQVKNFDPNEPIPDGGGSFIAETFEAAGDPYTEIEQLKQRVEKLESLLKENGISLPAPLTNKKASGV